MYSHSNRHAPLISRLLSVWDSGLLLVLLIAAVIRLLLWMPSIDSHTHPFFHLALYSFQTKNTGFRLFLLQFTDAIFPKIRYTILTYVKAGGAHE